MLCVRGELQIRRGSSERDFLVDEKGVAEAGHDELSVDQLRLDTVAGIREAVELSRIADSVDQAQRVSAAGGVRFYIEG